MTVHIHRHGKSRDAGTTTLWKFNKVTGYWVYQRTCSEEEGSQWLKIFKSDEPKESFKLSKNKPSGRPTGDLALNKTGEPATDAERRNCICKVAELADCTRGTAENYLKLNDWNIQAAVKDLEADRKQGFAIDKVRDAASSENEMDKQIRDAYAELCKLFDNGRSTAGSRRKFIELNYAYHKAFGKWHPLAREMD